MYYWNEVPWFRTSDPKYGDEWIEVYGPYDRIHAPQSKRHSQPSFWTVTGPALRCDFHGIDTATIELDGRVTVCNHVQFGKRSKPLLQPPIKQTIIVDSKKLAPDNMLRLLCLTLSDVICIISNRIDESACELILWVQSQEDLQEVRWPKIVISVGSNIGHMHLRNRFERECYEALRSKFSDHDGGKYVRLKILLGHALTNCQIFQNVSSSYKLHDIVNQSYKVCEEVLQREWQLRKKSSNLWSLMTFVQLVEQFCKTDPYPPSMTDLVRKLREKSWPSAHLKNYCSLDKWFSLTREESTIQEFWAPVLANLFLKDARCIPQGFSNRQVFEGIYKPLCKNALDEASQVSAWTSRVSITDLGDAIIHEMDHWSRRTRSRVQTLMQSVTNTKFCSLCLWNSRPIIIFKCGHGICERDAWTYSTREDPLYTISYFEVCPACSHQVKLWVRLRPLQAGFRVATFDGGGVLGKVSLLSLEHIMSKLPFGLQLYEWWDLVAGTSTGAIDAAVAIKAGLSAAECSELFSDTVEEVFKETLFIDMLAWIRDVERRIIRLNSVQSIRKVLKDSLEGLLQYLAFPMQHYRLACFIEKLKTCMTGSLQCFVPLVQFTRLVVSGAKYKNDALLHALQKICHNAPIRGESVQSPLETVRLAITVTDLASKLYLYCSPKHVTTQDSNDIASIPLSQAIAMSCAPRPYFPPIDYWKNGTFYQDGAFAANNPLPVALGELNKISLLPQRMLDYAVSFGTGQFQTESNQGHHRGLWQCVPQWIPTFMHSIMQSFSASSQYERTYDQLGDNEQHKIHRIDPQIPSSPIALDDFRSMENIKDQTKSLLEVDEDIQEYVARLTLAMLATGLYGVALSSPNFDGVSGFYRMRIAIVSRWQENHLVRSKIQNHLHHSRGYFADETDNINYTNYSRYAQIRVQRQVHLFSDPLEVEILARSLDEKIFIDLHLKNGRSHPISGFPLSLNELVLLQGSISTGAADSGRNRKRKFIGSRAYDRSPKQRCPSYRSLPIRTV